MATARKPRKRPAKRKSSSPGIKRRKGDLPIPSDPLELAKAGEELARVITDVLSVFVPGAPEVTRHKRDQSIRTAEMWLRDHGLYQPKSRKLTPSRRKYIKGLVRKHREVIAVDERNIPKFLFAPAKTRGQKGALKEAKQHGFRTTRKGIFVERSHHVAARIGYDPHFKKYYVERIPRRRKKGEPPRKQETPREYLAGFDELVSEEKKFARRARKLQKSLKKGQSLKFVVYGRGISHAYFEDAKSLLNGFKHYLGYVANPYDFITNLSIIIVDDDEENEDIYDRLFDPDTGKLKDYHGR
jgi:hypothetical protein